MNIIQFSIKAELASFVHTEAQIGASSDHTLLPIIPCLVQQRVNSFKDGQLRGSDPTSEPIHLASP